MKSPLVRLAIAAAVVALIFVGVHYSRQKGGLYRDVHVPKESIHSIPMEIGKWKGKDVPIDEKLFRSIDAHEVFSRNYSSPASESGITLHCAVFTTFWRDVPHPPKICYPGSGWTTIKEEDFELYDPDGLPATARLITFEKNGQTIFVLYWFQFGDFIVCDSWQVMNARWEYRNEETWPANVKVMLQISADRPDRARKQLKEFADEIHKITRTFK